MTRAEGGAGRLGKRRHSFMCEKVGPGATPPGLEYWCLQQLLVDILMIRLMNLLGFNFFF